VPLVWRWHEQADMTGNLDAVALPGGHDLTVHFHATHGLGQELDTGSAQRCGMPGEIVLSSEDDREHHGIQHAWCGTDELDIEEPVIAHDVWGHAQDGAVMGGVEHGAHNIALRRQCDSVSGSV